ncbi:MAG: NAD-dependent epimerase/dehydratase family protein [Planctomycetes bacterium]|nr:NAD-dependent epimerase/dehydratase family protein [Planctomycetota bacterium]
MESVNVITGAAGLVGSHIAEQLCKYGAPVRALVREKTDTRFLKTLPVEIVPADLRDLRKTPRALENAGTVYHCAAFVRDWGAWPEFYDGTVELTRRVVDACRDAGTGRFVHVSSISVYGNPPESAGQIIEDTPTDQHLWHGDHYGRSKVLAEEVVRAYDDHVIVRPSWIYGRRDLVSIPRVIEALRTRKVKLIGSGDNMLNLVNARDVARGIVLAANSPQARGQAYHLCNRGEITQREFFALLSDRLGLPPVKRRVPFGLAWNAARLLEFVYRAVGAKSPPPVTRRALLLLSRPTRFSIEKAERELSWRPEVPVREGLDDVLDWLKSDECTQQTARKKVAV